MHKFTKTINKGFDGVFTEVDHKESLGLKNPHELRLFHLDVANNLFSFDELHRFLRRNIGRYVFSRTAIEQFYIDEEIEDIGTKAIELLRSAYRMDEDQISEELGDIMLYVFLEQMLEAPKLYSKIELNPYGSQITSNGGGVHLLSLDNGGRPAYQMVFGKSKIVGDLRNAIDNAFKALVELKNDTRNELKILESTVLYQAYDPETTEYLKSIIIPSKKINASVDKAFGIFLGYSIGLKPENYSNEEFREKLMEKMNRDIKADVAYIIDKINEENLGSHSFYFYILPFNDADGEKKGIMNALLLKGGI